MKEQLILIGTGPSARNYLAIVRKYDLFDVTGFAVNDSFRICDRYMGLPVFSLERLENEVTGDFRVFVALEWNRLNADRRNLFDYCREKGFKFASIISPLSQNFAKSIGDNCFVGDFSVLYDECILGDDVICLGQNCVGQDTSVGDHSFLSQQASIADMTTVGSQCFIGINSCIFHELTIGDKCIIGGGAVVKRDLPDFSSIRVSDESMTLKQYDANVIESKLVANKYR